MVNPPVAQRRRCHSTLLVDFRWLLFSASLATILGAILIPTFQRAFCRAVEHFQVH
ncbi:lipid II flippase family protein, partial [Vibrio parahaemolyticus]|uniref:lipid II flippase family protein n=1 Tax=Vibrio parahaemolyticus TaxID=670 RepID=UPI003529198E